MLSLNFGTELSAANLHFTHIITFDFISSLACTAKQLCTLHYTKTVPSSKANNCWLVVAKNTMLAKLWHKGDRWCLLVCLVRLIRINTRSKYPSGVHNIEQPSYWIQSHLVLLATSPLKNEN